jgi:hypothetical protein
MSNFELIVSLTAAEGKADEAGDTKPARDAHRRQQSKTIKLKAG